MKHLGSVRLRDRAELQSRSKTPDGYGGNSVTWAKDRDLWCEIKDLAGAERLEAMRLEAQMTHQIYARAAADLTADKRIVHGGKAYNIRAVLHVDRERTFVRMLADQGVAS